MKKEEALARIFHDRPKREVESLAQRKEVVKKRAKHIEHMLSEAFVRLTQECQGFRRRSRLGNEISGLGPGDTTGLDALKSLQENAESFFCRIKSRYESQMNCKKGCTSCCYVALDIFESEAARIIDWALGLEPEEQKLLKEGFAQYGNSGDDSGGIGTDPAGNVRPKCAALLEGTCSIYAARPIICRTQGSPLQWKSQNETGSNELSQDICPLNFKDYDRPLQSIDWLDLDKLSALQSIAENQFQRVGRKFKWKKTSDGRVPLTEVISYLKKCIL